MRWFAGAPPRGEPRAVRMRAWATAWDYPDFPVSVDDGRGRPDEIPPGRPRVPASHDGEVAVGFELK